MTIAATILHNIGAYLKLTGIHYQKDDSFITIDFAEIPDAAGLGIVSFVIEDKTNDVFFLAENPFETIDFGEDVEIKIKDFCHQWLWENKHCAAFPIYDDEYGLRLIFKYPCFKFYNNPNFQDDFSAIWQKQSKGLVEFFKQARKDFTWIPHIPKNILSDFAQIRMPEF